MDIPSGEKTIEPYGAESGEDAGFDGGENQGGTEEEGDSFPYHNDSEKERESEGEISNDALKRLCAEIIKRAWLDARCPIFSHRDEYDRITLQTIKEDAIAWINGPELEFVIEAASLNISASAIREQLKKPLTKRELATIRQHKEQEEHDTEEIE